MKHGIQNYTHTTSDRITDDVLPLRDANFIKFWRIFLGNHVYILSLSLSLSLFPVNPP
jgi:hypothetical protein